MKIRKTLKIKSLSRLRSATMSGTSASSQKYASSGKGPMCFHETNHASIDTLTPTPRSRNLFTETPTRNEVVSRNKKPWMFSAPYLGPFSGLNFFTDFNDGMSDKEAIARFKDTLSFVQYAPTAIARHLQTFRRHSQTAPANYLDTPESRAEIIHDRKAHRERFFRALSLGHGTHLDIQNFQDIPCGDILYAGLAIQRLAGRPNRDLHVHVTDPGVGNVYDSQGIQIHDRSILITKNHGVLIGPNNGSLAMLAYTLQSQSNEKLYRLLRINLQQAQELERLRRRDPSYKLPDIFHARDAFSVIAAAIAAGIDPHLLGDEDPNFSIRSTDFAKSLKTAPMKNDDTQTFEAIRDRTFGNLKTNLLLTQSEAELLQSEQTYFKIRNDKTSREIVAPFKAFFSQVKKGEALAYLGSTEVGIRAQRLVELAINMGDMSNELDISAGNSVTLKISYLSGRHRAQESDSPVARDFSPEGIEKWKSCEGLAPRESL